MEMQKTLGQKSSQTLIYSVEDFLAKLFPLLESVRDSEKLVVRSSLKSLGLPEIKSHNTCSLKMLKDSFQQTMDGVSQKSCVHWMNWGMIANGRFLTANFLEFHRIGKGCSLSDILEENPTKKYFLSEEQIIPDDQFKFLFHSKEVPDDILDNLAPELDEEKEQRIRTEPFKKGDIVVSLYDTKVKLLSFICK